VQDNLHVGIQSLQPFVFKEERIPTWRSSFEYHHSKGGSSFAINRKL